MAHPSKAERAAAGKAARAEVPRSSHAVWEPPADRRDPIELLLEEEQTRVRDLVPIRHGRMLVSAFTFYRGTAGLMAADLAGSPRTALHTQLCGDAHLSNFGAFAAPDRRLIFGLNDFDETLPGPFEWDVKRLAASFAVAGRDRGFDAKQRQQSILAAVRSYRVAVREFAEMRRLDVWYARLDIEQLAARWSSDVSAKQVKRFERNVAKARTKDSLRASDKLTHVVDGRVRIISDPPLIVPLEELEGESVAVENTVRSVLRSYRRSMQNDRRHLLEGFEYAHSARKVVGVGSVGTRAWIVLLLGRDESDPLFLQLKEAEASVLEPYLGASRFGHSGQRVVEGQRLMQSASDIMLGWTRSTDAEGVDHEFYFRQLWDGKGSAIVETMEPAALTAYAEMCGWTLAHAHARSGDAVAIASYLGAADTFDRALATFAEAYADQNERDFAAFSAAIASGRIEAVTGL
ncbi:DUF2252 domain-containing protein [Solirubrobacter ginsenosidimutans]|uniref:DUF2252 domain-containing protein n=1 Tax=Solirubrobacter ginsenosidimutans TaxID=490573 RepID=A0A9X3MVM5_9ACTN|nr:DUF2252 domain-containing protein [Solirubrobacter ginsenosidimutans]MDA0160778.1 DUF2252 domain-containing protein [Solirubrobacter ginsenosidimutans]